MDKAKFDKYMKDNPYNQYVNNRTRELGLNVAKRLMKKRDDTSWLKFIVSLCQSLAMAESQILQSQAVLNDPSPYNAKVRDQLLTRFGKSYIHDVISKNNHALTELKAGDDK